MTAPLQRAILRPRRSRFAADAATPTTAAPKSTAMIAKPMKNRTI